MIQVYKKNDLFIIKNTITDILYPNLTKQETIQYLKMFGREENRIENPIEEFSNDEFEYYCLDNLQKENEILNKALDKIIKMYQRNLKINFGEIMEIYDAEYIKNQLLKEVKKENENELFD